MAIAKVIMTVGAIEEGGVIGIPIHPAKPTPANIDRKTVPSVIPTITMDRSNRNITTVIIKYMAGIRVIMVTGDHPETARYIAFQTGLVDSAQARTVNGQVLADAQHIVGAA